MRKKKLALTTTTTTRTRTCASQSAADHLISIAACFVVLCFFMKNAIRTKQFACLLHARARAHVCVCVSILSHEHTNQRERVFEKKNSARVKKKLLCYYLLTCLLNGRAVLFEALREKQIASSLARSAGGVQLRNTPPPPPPTGLNFNRRGCLALSSSTWRAPPDGRVRICRRARVRVPMRRKLKQQQQ